MKLISEFKAFAMRGNVVDMAVGIIIGGAFGKIVSSVVADVIMPPIGLLLGGVKFTDLKIVLFMMIKAMNSMKKKEEAPVEAPAPPPPSNEEVLLAEIRDLLKNK